MRALNISISELEYNKCGLKVERLPFSELLNIVSGEVAEGNLQKPV